MSSIVEELGLHTAEQRVVEELRCISRVGRRRFRKRQRWAGGRRKGANGVALDRELRGEIYSAAHKVSVVAA